MHRIRSTERGASVTSWYVTKPNAGHFVDVFVPNPEASDVMAARVCVLKSIVDNAVGALHAKYEKQLGDVAGHAHDARLRLDAISEVRDGVRKVVSDMQIALNFAQLWAAVRVELGCGSPDLDAGSVTDRARMHVASVHGYVTTRKLVASRDRDDGDTDDDPVDMTLLNSHSDAEFDAMLARLVCLAAQSLVCTTGRDEKKSWNETVSNTHVSSAVKTHVRTLADARRALAVFPASERVCTVNYNTFGAAVHDARDGEAWFDGVHKTWDGHRDHPDDARDAVIATIATGTPALLAGADNTPRWNVGNEVNPENSVDDFYSANRGVATRGEFDLFVRQCTSGGDAATANALFETTWMFENGVRTNEDVRQPIAANTIAAVGDVTQLDYDYERVTKLTDLLGAASPFRDTRGHAHAFVDAACRWRDPRTAQGGTQGQKASQELGTLVTHLGNMGITLLPHCKSGLEYRIEGADNGHNLFEALATFGKRRPPPRAPPCSRKYNRLTPVTQNAPHDAVLDFDAEGYWSSGESASTLLDVFDAVQAFLAAQTSEQGVDPPM